MACKQHSIYSVNHFLPFRRLWPSLEGLHRYELHPLFLLPSLACWQTTARCSGCQHQELTNRGCEWVGFADACFGPQDFELTSIIVNVAKKTGLLVPDLPAHVLKVPNAECIC